MWQVAFTFSGAFTKLDCLPDHMVESVAHHVGCFWNIQYRFLKAATIFCSKAQLRFITHQGAGLYSAPAIMACLAVVFSLDCTLEPSGTFGKSLIPGFYPRRRF